MQFSFGKTFLISILLSLFSTSIFANGAELSLNNDAVRIAGDWSLGNNGIEIEGSILNNQDSGYVASIAGMKFGNAGSDGLNAGIGVNLSYVNPDESTASAAVFPIIPTSSPDGGSLSIGGKVRYVPPQYNRVNVGAYAWFAPEVLTFGDLDKYQEIGIYAGYNVIRDADVFVGYRNVKGKFSSNDNSFGNITIDSGLHAGIRVTF